MSFILWEKNVLVLETCNYNIQKLDVISTLIKVKKPKLSVYRKIQC